MGIEIDLTDVRAVASRIATAGPRMGAAASLALRKTAYDIEADAKALAPVDTGNLRNSISAELTGDGRSGAMSAEIGPTAEYGIYQEYGTSTQPGHPYLGPAYDRRVGPYSEALVQLAAQAVLE